MRKIGFTAFKDTTKEVLPKTYKVNDIICQRKMFCTMINQYLSKESQLDLHNLHIYKQDLLSIFEDKILSFFPFYGFKPEKSQKIRKLYIHDSQVFNQYFKQSKNIKMRYLTSNIHFKQDFKLMYGYQHPAMDLIQLIFNGKEVEMMLDLNEIFTRTVFNRIKKEKNKKVRLQNPYIHIDQHGVTTRLLPRWKNVNHKNLHQRDLDIKIAFEQLKTQGIDQYYLIYPKKDNFKQHMIIEDSSSNEQIKMIPYSFTFCNKHKKKERKKCKK